MAARCTTPSCGNFGNAARGGRCNACAGGAPPTRALPAPSAPEAGAAGAAAAPAPAAPGDPSAAPAASDDDLAAALAASAALHSATIDAPLVAEAYALERPAGRLAQVGVLNQFHRMWAPLIAEHGTAAAICGYAALAHAELLAALAAAGALPAGAAALRGALADFGALAPRVGAHMAAVRAARARYVAAHAGDFADARARAEYLAAWVANYEMSDALRALDPALSQHVVFVRVNEWPAAGEARHEERARLAEEAPFASRFLVETFAAAGARARRLAAPADALAARGAAAWRVAVVDVHGHFAVAAADADAGGVVLLNTTSANYITAGSWGADATALAHDLLCGPRGGGA